MAQLIFFTGPMNCGKSTLALQTDFTETQAGRSGRLFSRDDRAGAAVISSRIGLDQHAAYCASKAAVIGLTHVLSLEWARHGITVNAVSPTVVETPLGKAAWAGEKGEKAMAEIPVGRFAQPEEVAALIAFLAGDDAAMITGSNYLIDGGFTTV